MIHHLHHLRKLTVLGFLCASPYLFAPYACAQLSRAEKKLWKKELRKMSPEGMKKMMEEKKNLSSMLNILNNETVQLKTDASEKDQEITFLKSEVDELRENLKTREIQMGLINENGERWDSGVVFKVQIGALKPKDFPEKKERSYTLEVEDGGRYMQYVVGNFRNYREADALKKHMRQVGMSKAWIVPYKNGKRVPLKDVLEFVLDD